MIIPNHNTIDTMPTILARHGATARQGALRHATAVYDVTGAATTRPGTFQADTLTTGVDPRRRADA